MMRYAWILSLALLGSSASAQTINNLNSGTALGGTEQIPMFQGSNPAVTTTPNAIKTFVGGVKSLATSCPGGVAINPSTGDVTLGLQTVPRTATDPPASPVNVNTDCGGIIYLNSAVDRSPVLANPSGTGFPAGWATLLCNINAAQTLTPTAGTIGGAATKVLGAGTASSPVCLGVISNGVNNYSLESFASPVVITAASTATSGFTDGDLISSSSSKTADSGLAVTNVPTLSGNNTYAGLANFTSTFQVNSNTISWPASTITVARTDAGQTFTGNETFLGTVSDSVSGAASTPALLLSGTILSGGTGTTNFPQFLVQPSGATASATWSTTGTAIGVNLGVAAGNLIDLQTSGVSKLSVTQAGVVTSGSQIIAGGTITALAGNISASNNGATFNVRGGGTVWSSPANGTWVSGNADAAAPVAQTLQAQSVVAGTSNTAGQNWTLNNSRGTGTGAGGDLLIQVAKAGTTGTAQNALATAFSVRNTGVIQTNVVFSAAGTALPTCNGAAEGSWAAVSDATTPTYNAAYVSGGAVHVPVYCDGTGWKTH